MIAEPEVDIAEFPECEPFVHRPREWCRCEGGDNRKSDNWRVRHGLCKRCNVTAPPPDHTVTTVRPQAQMRGLGDAVHAVTTATGIAAAVHTVEKITGWDCGCNKRRELLNQAVPFGK